MKAIIALIAVFIFLFFIFKTPVFAGDVVINEFLVEPNADQWVELYNKGTGSIDISGWIIDDSGGTQKFTIPDSTLINPEDFKVFESGDFNLDWASDDTIQLLNNNSLLEDSYSYNTGPGPDRSYGRNTDGTGSWVTFSSPTKGLTNNNSTPVPTSTPTPTPTPTPVPTNTPIPTSAPTSNASSNPYKTPIPSPAKSPSPTVKPTSASVTLASSDSTGEVIPTSVLNDSAESEITDDYKTSQITPVEKTKVLGVQSNSLPKILITIGVVLLLVCGILIFRTYIRSKKDSGEV